MALSIYQIENTFFQFLACELTLNEFEQWLYSTSEIEGYLGEAAYLELISFDFRQPDASYELSKLIHKYTTPSKFYTWQIKRLLNSLLDRTQDPIDAFEKLYDLYCKGYLFLREIGIQYVLGIDELPRLVEQNRWDENEFFRRRKILDKYLEPLQDEIQIILHALETGEINLIDESKYSITPELLEKLNELHNVSQHQNPRQPVRHKRAWWRFW